MSYKNFIPTVWAAGIQRELERNCVFAEDCNREYEGDVKALGDSVTILGVGSPTIYDRERKDSSKDINDAETIEDTSIKMNINQIAYYNFLIDDIDKRQAVKGVMAALRGETSEKLANKQDNFIAAFAKDKFAPKVYTNAVKIVADKVDATGGAVWVLDAIDLAEQKLRENDVADATPIVLTVSPRFFTLFRKAYRTDDTNNSKILKNGKVAQYNNITIKRSNNVAKSDDGKTDFILCRTKRAVAFVNPMIHAEPYRPEKKFSDAIKGFILYDGKIVRPKEMNVLNVKYE